MYALIETGGKQFKVAAGGKIMVDRIEAEPGAEIKLDKVLAVVKEDGTIFGKPYIEKASVKAEVVGTSKMKKVLVFKQKTRTHFRKLRGHRQQITTLMIKEIEGV